MKKLANFFDIVITLHFFTLANVYFWGSLFALFGMPLIRPGLLINPWVFAINILLAPFLIYGAILFFQKSENRYSYGLILLSFDLVETQIFRFFFITHQKLEIIDLSNLVFFGIPILIIYLIKYLNTKYVSGY